MPFEETTSRRLGAFRIGWLRPVHPHVTPLELVLAASGISILAGGLGSLLGLGGGIIVVPALTLLLGIDRAAPPTEVGSATGG